MKEVVLVGNPNSGKTTLFNELTGTRQRVGNWPGVTVEKKTGTISSENSQLRLVDLPGTYSLDPTSAAVDEQIARDYLNTAAADLIINVVDATSLSRGLFLTSQLCELDTPTIVVLNMLDTAERRGLSIDHQLLSERLGVPVICTIASNRTGLPELTERIESLAQDNDEPKRTPQPIFTDADARYRFIDNLIDGVTSVHPVTTAIADRIDRVILNRYLAFPIFLAAMYLMFLFSINLGSALIDWFDLLGLAIFVEAPRWFLTQLGTPEFITAFIADGVGGGLQLVASFIPVIGCLFLALAFLEDSGYMARVAFIVDRLMRSLGLPGKSFVPLIVGFGCNVPAVMATRALDNQPDRILTTIMAPYMSCGARLTVYALFAVAFFPSGGQNIVFGLYIVGIVVALLSAFTVRKHLLPQATSSFVIELPAYHWPTTKGLLIQTWQRLRGFVLRAGKAIVAVVIVLNILSSAGVDGSFGNQDSETSVLAAIGKSITPAFYPMGITDDNWPATVGIFTGIFAKEVVVGTLDALYSPALDEAAPAIPDIIRTAFASVPANLRDLAGQLADPLGISLGNLEDTASQATEQEVQLGTIATMQRLFASQLAAFSYLVFILLYMPCVATIGVIYKELGGFWAAFSTAWSIVVAYGSAVLVYQVGSFFDHPGSSSVQILAVLTISVLAFFLLLRWGKHKQPSLIPVTHID